MTPTSHLLKGKDSFLACVNNPFKKENNYHLNHVYSLGKYFRERHALN